MELLNTQLIRMNNVPKETLNFVSHTRTVVGECCKGDDTCQWGNGKFDPCHAQTP